jgi:hypothetical protein
MSESFLTVRGVYAPLHERCTLCVAPKNLFLTCSCPSYVLRVLVAGNHGVVGSAAEDGGVVFWNRESAQHLSTLKNAHKSAVVACSWGSNDQLATVEREHSLVFWE